MTEEEIEKLKKQRVSGLIEYIKATLTLDKIKLTEAKKEPCMTNFEQLQNTVNVDFLKAVFYLEKQGTIKIHQGVNCSLVEIITNKNE